MEININEIMESVTKLADSAVQLAKDVTVKATQKTNDVVGISKLKLDAIKLENEIKSLTQKLGAVVYEMTESGINEPEKIDQYVAEINVKKAQLAAIEKKIAALRKTVVCDACKSINPKDAFFCSRCGAPLPATEPECDEPVCEEEEIVVEAEEPSEEPEVEEIIEQAMVDGADEETAEAVAAEAVEAIEEDAE